MVGLTGAAALRGNVAGELVLAASRVALRGNTEKSSSQRWRLPLISNTWIGDLAPVVRLFVVTYLAVFLWFAAVKPCITFDARSIFGLKARILDDGGTLASEDFRDPDRLNFNANYPLFIPVVEAALFHARGSQNAVGLQLLFAGFVLACALIIAAEVRRFDSPQVAAIWAASLMLLPMTLSPVEGGGLSGSVDYPFAALALAAVIATGRWLAIPCLRHALLAGFCWGACADQARRKNLAAGGRACHGRDACHPP